MARTHDRSEWTRGRSGELQIKNRTYKDLVEFTRPCASCGKPFSIFVTSKIAAGQADSNSFGLKNCPEHRRNTRTADTSETEALRMANSVMKAELDGLYARLAQYELQPAMKARAASDGLTFPWQTD